ncbi:hypothetical protein AK812_SmicGene22988 [Symbiodinium microadriaticum]|uniref:Uncharacterized protein n=1 Tax=Symbiodinium microadriaticum TaxID=2951 RepID=A0A1Q9DID8_SYMMI|nr:hypothetical protein AK812_SmicGene22988 [Symbiodinium microadriaticum]
MCELADNASFKLPDTWWGMTRAPRENVFVFADRVLTFIIEDLAAASERLLSRGRQMSDEAKRVRVVERPEKATIRAFVDCPGTGKTTMLKSLFAEYHDGGRWVLPVSQDIGPRSQLDLTDVVQTLSEKCIRESGGPLIVYLQLSTKNRETPFTDDQCDAIGTEIGAFGRKLTYDYPLCKLVVELSVSLIADKIQELRGQNRASRVLPSFVELALETPEIASNLNMDKLSQEEVLKYFYLRASGSFRELQRLLKNAAMANASDAQGIKAQIDEWYRTKIQPIKDVLADRGLTDRIFSSVRAVVDMARHDERGG